MPKPPALPGHAKRDLQMGVYPSAVARTICGETGPACTVAIEAMAAILTAATAALPFDRADWSLLAAVLRDSPADAGWHAGMVAQEVERPESERARIAAYGKRRATARTGTLLNELCKLDYPAAQAILVAVRWYWRHAEEIDPARDEWWTISFRRQLAARQREETNS